MKVGMFSFKIQRFTRSGGWALAPSIKMGRYMAAIGLSQMYWKNSYWEDHWMINWRSTRYWFFGAQDGYRANTMHWGTSYTARVLWFAVCFRVE